MLIERVALIVAHIVAAGIVVNAAAILIFN